MSTMHKRKCSSINVLILESSPQSLTMTLLKLPLWQQLSPLETCLLIKLLKHSSEFPTHRANEQNVPVGQKPLINHCFQPFGLWYFVTAAIANYTKVCDNPLEISFFKSLLSMGTDFVWGTGLLKATFISKPSSLAVLFLCLIKSYFTSNEILTQSHNQASSWTKVSSSSLLVLLRVCVLCWGWGAIYLCDNAYFLLPSEHKCVAMWYTLEKTKISWFYHSSPTAHLCFEYNMKPKGLDLVYLI